MTELEKNLIRQNRALFVQQCSLLLAVVTGMLLSENNSLYTASIVVYASALAVSSALFVYFTFKVGFKSKA